MEAGSGEGAARLVLLLVALLILLANIWSGWRSGPVRMVCTIVALACAYVAGFSFGNLALPILRPWIGLPDFVLIFAGGALVGLIVYIAITVLSSVIFKKTKHQSSGVVRMAYGLSGGVLGAVFGLIVLWGLAMAMNLLGTVAQSRLEVGDKLTGTTGADGRVIPPPEVPRIVQWVASVKKVLNTEGPRQVIETVDVVPAEVHETFGNLAKVVADPDAVNRFLQYPGAAEIIQHPTIRELQSDPEIAEEASSGRYFALLRNPKLIDAMNDPGLSELLKKFDLQNAMDYALKPSPPNPAMTDSPEEL